MKITHLILLTSLWITPAFAYKYGEHKAIGDAAFSQFIRALNSRIALSPFLSLMNTQANATDSNYFFRELSVDGGNSISYGVLNGLSGDHESNPLLLEEQLRNRSSVMQAIISLHNQYIAMGFTAAPDGKLTRLDVNYALAAALNISHFYEYNKTFQQQLRHFDKAVIRQCENPSLVTAACKKLNGTNAINMYVTLHALAIDVAEQSGQLATSHPVEAQRLLLYAMLFNGFADHFLEDAFSAGHLVVNRVIAASITNNKALHDFYCEDGATVVNLKGEIWKAYGDGQFNNAHHQWQQQSSLLTIQYHTYTTEAERIIHAVHLSLQDIQQAFERSYSDSHYTPFLHTIPDGKDQQSIFLITHIASLQLVPIPYNSRLETLFANPVNITETMKKANQILPYRNFIRSRVANSLVISLISPAFADLSLKGFEFRANAGSFLKHYRYNSSGGKKGTLDYWSGYTISYTIAEQGNFHDKYPQEHFYTHQLRAGLRNNADFWFTNRKFIGLYGYAEAGIQWVDRNAEFIFAPSIGLQLGSLFNVNYYNMPGWLRIPAQYFLPLKLRYGSVISPNQPPHYYSGVDLDIFF